MTIYSTRKLIRRLVSYEVYYLLCMYGMFANFLGIKFSWILLGFLSMIVHKVIYTWCWRHNICIWEIWENFHLGKITCYTIIIFFLLLPFLHYDKCNIKDFFILWYKINYGNNLFKLYTCIWVHGCAHMLSASKNLKFSGQIHCCMHFWHAHSY